MQIQAYLDNVFDVGGLLEDAETKNVALEKVEELEDHLSHVRNDWCAYLKKNFFIMILSTGHKCVYKFIITWPE